MALPQLDINRLSPEERIQLAVDLWNSLLDRPEQISLTAAQEEELDRRLHAYRQDRKPGEPWREALAERDQLRDVGLEELRREVERGVDQLDRGQSRPFDPEAIKDRARARGS